MQFLIFHPLYCCWAACTFLALLYRVNNHLVRYVASNATILPKLKRKLSPVNSALLRTPEMLLPCVGHQYLPFHHRKSTIPHQAYVKVLICYAYAEHHPLFLNFDVSFSLPFVTFSYCNKPYMFAILLTMAALMPSPSSILSNCKVLGNSSNSSNLTRFQHTIGIPVQCLFF